MTSSTIKKPVERRVRGDWIKVGRGPGIYYWKVLEKDDEKQI